MPPQNEPLAMWAMISGILSLVCCGCIAGLPAIVMGHMSLGKIAKSGGVLGGKGMAMAGLILGYLSLVLTIIFSILYGAAIAAAVANGEHTMQ